MKKFFSKDNKTVKQIKNWYQDRYETVLIQRNILFVLVAIFVVVFGFTIIGVIELNSTKVYEPFIVQIEENTGVITKVNNKSVRELSAQKSVRNASLVKYVLARESYNYADYQFNYFKVVRLMSDPEVFSEFTAKVSPANPESPISLSFDYKIDAKIKSIVDFDDQENLVQIRISKSKVGTKSRSGKPEWVKDYIITLRYAYRDLELTETERYINPLGMQVVGYRIDEEQSAKRI